MAHSAATGLQLLWALAPAVLLVCATALSGFLLLAADWAFKSLRAPVRERR